MEGLGALVGIFAFLGIFIFVIVIVIYILQAIFLNKFNKLVYGKGTALAWIPICNLYLLGKLTVNKLVGWILVILLFITGETTTTINGVTTTQSILPQGINSIISPIYSLAVLGLFIYAIVKYFQLKKSGVNNQVQDVQMQQTMQQSQVNQQQFVQQPMQQQVNQPLQQGEQIQQNMQSQQPLPQQNEQVQQNIQPQQDIQLNQGQNNNQ